jgi:PhzF family phenazine biosynthesis protein
VKPVPLFQVDAFTSEPFGGNPAAVCLLSEPADGNWMQQVAREMNLSETAFLHPVPDGHRLRWFTPVAEVDLCGHATLATAHVLGERGELPEGGEARFHTLSGLLTATRRAGMILLDFPADPDREVEIGADVTEALGVRPRYLGRGRFDLIAELDSEAELRSLSPDFTRLARLSARGMIVTSRSEAGHCDFVSRFFAPALGVDEDPVTGSAHCTLACFWSSRLGKTEFRAYQASARGGSLTVSLSGDRVVLGGSAVTVMRGELLR